jgi:hypothetical protein
MTAHYPQAGDTHSGFFRGGEFTVAAQRNREYTHTGRKHFRHRRTNKRVGIGSVVSSANQFTSVVLFITRVSQISVD